VTDRELVNLREAQQIAGVGSWEWIPRTDAQQWSLELSRIFGRDPSLPPPSQEDFLTYLHPDDRPRARECVDATFKTGAPFRMDVRIVRSDGETRTVALRGRLSRGDDGGPSRLIGVAQDITERKQAEEALRQSEEQSRVLFEHQIIAMAITSPDKGIVRVNDQFCRLLGYSREDLAHMTWRDFTHPDDLADSLLQFNRAMAGEIDSYSLEKRYVRKDGEIVYGHASLGCVRNPDGSMAYLLALLSDVTERKKAEEGLRKSEEAYRRLFELSPDPIVAWSPDGVFNAANQAAATLLGLDTPEEVVGKRWTDFVAPEDRAARAETLRKVETRGGVNESEFRLQRKDGSRVLVQARVHAALDDEGNSVQTISMVRDVTERRKAEEALRESEEAYRGLFESVPDGIVGWDSDGIITTANEATAALLGFDKTDDVIGRRWLDFVEQEDVPRRVETLRALHESGGAAEAEFRMRRKDGTRFDAYGRQRVVLDSEGNFVQAVAIARDITARKQSEEALQLSEARFRSIFEGAGHGMALLDLDGHFLNVNASFSRITGYGEDEMRGLTFLDITHPDDLAESAATAQQMGKGEISGLELTKRYVRKDGGIVWVQLNVSAVHDAAGAPVYRVCQVQDITKRVRADAALRQSLEQMRVVFEHQIIAISLTSLEKGFVRVNDQFCRLFGYSREELAHLSWADITYPDDRAISAVQFGRIMAGEIEAYSLEKRYIRKDGELIFAELSCGAVRNQDGSLEYLLSLLSDITERKRAEEELHAYRQHLEDLVTVRTADLAKTNEELQAVNQELETFSYSVSHDLRTPLRAIDGFSSMLLKDYSRKLNPEGRRMLNVVHDNTVRMGRLIDDILAFSRSGRGEMSLAMIDMDRSVRTVIEEMAPVLAGRKLRFDIKPLAAAQGDGAMIRRVWTNLIDNAVKFTANKSEAVIEIGSTEGEKDIIYYVSDGGVGFDMQYVDKLFGVFQRLHSSEFDGTGIGLAIIKRIIARHGGRVWAEGKVNEGATVYFTLPTWEKADA
jgi:PAS domain S-box-containing protein